MNINYFPRQSFEKFTLGDLRLFVKFAELLLPEISLPEEAYLLKWEQTLAIHNFNKRIVFSDESLSLNSIKNSLHTNSNREFSWDNINIIALSDLEHALHNSLNRKSIPIAEFISQYNFVNESDFILFSARKNLEKCLEIIEKFNPHRSWVGLDSNIRLQIGMNIFLELPKKDNRAFLLIK